MPVFGPPVDLQNQKFIALVEGGRCMRFDSDAPSDESRCSTLSILADSSSGLSPDPLQQNVPFKKDPQAIQMHVKVLETLLRFKKHGNKTHC